jgi:hypothetical protein
MDLHNELHPPVSVDRPGNDFASTSMATPSFVLPSGPIHTGAPVEIGGGHSPANSSPSFVQDSSGGVSGRGTRDAWQSYNPAGYEIGGGHSVQGSSGGASEREKRDVWESYNPADYEDG